MINAYRAITSNPKDNAYYAANTYLTASSASVTLLANDASLLPFTYRVVNASPALPSIQPACNALIKSSALPAQPRPTSSTQPPIGASYVILPWITALPARTPPIA